MDATIVVYEIIPTHNPLYILTNQVFFSLFTSKWFRSLVIKVIGLVAEATE